MTDPVSSVVNLKTSSYDVYVGRPGNGQLGLLGNPYNAESLGGGNIGRKEAITRFASYFRLRVTTDKEYAALVQKGKGKRLGCFCEPQLCHGRVIAHWLNTGTFADSSHVEKWYREILNEVASGVTAK